MSDINIYVDDSNLTIGGKVLNNRWASMPRVVWNYEINVLRHIIMQQCDFDTYGTGHLLVYGSNLRRDLQLNFLRTFNLVLGYDCPGTDHGQKSEVVARITTDMKEHAKVQFDAGMPCDIVLVSGDGDFVPAVVGALRFGSDVHLWTWKNSVSHKFITIQSFLINFPLQGFGQFRIHYLYEHLQELTRCPTIDADLWLLGVRPGEL